jgi:hypothetical protein
MRILIQGGGWYGSHLALALMRDGYQVELHEKARQLFAGASGGNPARLHQGWHYPRSRLTRSACQAHQRQFMEAYGHLTRVVPINLYAVAADDSLVDFGTYLESLRPDLECIRVAPGDFGLAHREGAVLTGERHIVIDLARHHFQQALGDAVRYESDGSYDSFDWSIDCTFCANDAENIDRFEPCVTGLLEGPVDKAVTIMDGPFPSIYPWNESKRLNSLTSAKYTPLARCSTHAEAREVLANTSREQARERCEVMLDQIAHYWPRVRDSYSIVSHKLTIRAMPRSGSAARLVDLVRTGPRSMRVRAGKIDAIFDAERLVKSALCSQ